VRVVHVVLPGDIDDPATPSGGNTYDRRVCAGLAARGWTVREYPVPGGWPRPDAADRAGLARVLAALPDAAPVLVDGLIASAVPDVLRPQADRLRLVVLVHMPLDDEAERAALACARAVIVTSAWTRRRLLDRYALPADLVRVALPGVDPAALAPGSASGPRSGQDPGAAPGGGLLCVAALTRNKGHDLLVEALAKAADLTWTCACVGSLDRDPAFADRIRRRVAGHGLAGRVRLAGPRTGADLDAAYAAADLLVLATRAETYGMVVIEALARGIPVLATAVGGVPEALGRAPDGSRPGLLVEPADPAAFAGALRRWLSEPDLRRGLRRSARLRRDTLTGWAATSDVVSTTLEGIRA
jgi:glycosyltransferase involved in cell wall biosynthesis